MRTRTLITGAAFLLVGVASAGKAHAQALNLRGSDTLDLVSTDVIAACTGATGNIVYVGGGSGAGQAAMASGTQHVAPMSRQLNGSQCTASSRQLLIGLDGIVVVAKNAIGADPTTCTDDIGGQSNPIVLTGVPTQFIPCTSNAACPTGSTCDTTRQFCGIGGTLVGCTAAQGCSPDGTYTFDNATAAAGDDWQDVLRQIYGGMNHVSSAANLVTSATEVNADGVAVCFGSSIVADGGACNATTACPAGQFCASGVCSHQVANTTARNCVRGPRIDCSNPVRGVLLSSYSSIIKTPLCTVNGPAKACATTADCPLGQTCNATSLTCQPSDCVKLRHAFRRDDLSGTTDAFQAIVGLFTLPPQTQQRSTVGGANAPEIADFASTANPFCNAGTASMNKGFSDGLDLDPYRRACSVGPAPDRLALEEVCQYGVTATNSDVACYVSGVTPSNYPQRERSSPQGRGVLPGGSTDTLAAFENDYRLTNATKPRCLGVVQPISIPQDLAGATVWAQFRYPAGGNCTAGVRAFVNPLPARAILCPDGTQKAAGGTCRLAQNSSNGRFDCVTDSTLGAGTVGDPRIFNMAPVNSAGNMASLLDSYQNPNFPGVNNIRRFARRYFGLHMVRPDNSQSTATTTSACTADNDTQQIGCLVKASPCSIGYAGREASDSVAPFQNVALNMVGIKATQSTIENLATGGTPVYPIARKLWFNSFQDPNIGFAQPALSDAELALANCMGLSGNTSIVDPIIQAHNFVVVPPSVPRLVTNSSGGGCPLP